MATRTITIRAHSDEYGNLIPPDRDRAAEAILDLLGSVYQLGGVFNVAVWRQPDDDDEYVTTAIVISHDTYAPAGRRQRPEPTTEAPAEPVQEPSLTGNPVEEPVEDDEDVPVAPVGAGAE